MSKTISFCLPREYFSPGENMFYVIVVMKLLNIPFESSIHVDNLNVNICNQVSGPLHWCVEDYLSLFLIPFEAGRLFPPSTLESIGIQMHILGESINWAFPSC